MTDHRRLIVMRHARAEPFAATDRVRRLTDRGVADAAEAGSHLAQHGFVPDQAIVSVAERTRMTWAAVREASGSQAEAGFDEAAYHGGTDSLVELVTAVAADAGTVIVIGHNPTIADLAHLLDDGAGDRDAISGMLRGFPPGALVVLEVTAPWSEAGPECGRVVDFFAPGG